MPGMNGIQCAKDIRMYDNFVKIVFLTSSTEYGIESYRVKAYDYLLKPLEKEKLFSVLSQIEKEKQKKEQNIFVLKSKIGITKISLSNLEYCEVVNRRVIFHILNEEEYECGLRMNEVEEKLMPLGCFVRPHRSFLINMNFIKTLNAHSIVMESGAQIPMPREKYAGIKSRYMEYIFQKSDTVLLGE